MWLVGSSDRTGAAKLSSASVDAGSNLTSAGTAAGIDLCLYIVRKDHGRRRRQRRRPPHGRADTSRGRAGQFVNLPLPAEAGSDPLGGLLDWMPENLDQPLTVDALAEKSAMSPRTFARRFGAATGSTPRQWILAQRVILAQRLLGTTDEPVEPIAARCRFGSAAGLRQHFPREEATSPPGLPAVLPPLGIV